MAGSNFQQWNPTQSNQENDQQYQADPQRSGGLQQRQIVAGVALNKVLYQASTFAAAFGIMMANKGYTTSDADVNVLAAVLANITTDGDGVPNFQALGYAPNITLDLSKALTFQVALGGDVNLGIANARNFIGQRRLIAFLQDGNGGHNVNYPVGAGENQMLGVGTPDPGANALSVQEFFVDGNGTLRAVTGQTVTP